MWLGILGLVAVICAVSWQVFGRYVSTTPRPGPKAWRCCWCCTSPCSAWPWACATPGHIGLESFLVLAPDWLRLKMEYLIHALVLLFGAGHGLELRLLAESCGTTACPRWDLRRLEIRARRPWPASSS
jgi:hypothetical protein